jgi:hypothetical protein
MACPEHGHSGSCYCDPKCPQCKNDGTLSLAYDCHYCKACNAWIEPVCENPDCRWCKNRTTLPVVPS